jgi:hypothetical protein
MKVYFCVPVYGVGVDPEIYRNHLALIASCNGLVKDIGIKIDQLVHIARNDLVEEVINDPNVNLKEDFMFWLDSDVIVGPGTIHRLISHNKDIVSGIYFQKSPPFYPLVMKKKEDTDKFARLLSAYPEGLHKIDRIGFGCVLTKVNVFKKIPKPWFEWTKESGEDIDFCIKAEKYGIDIWYDSAVLCGHMGPRYVVTSEDFNKIFGRMKNGNNNI